MSAQDARTPRDDAGSVPDLADDATGRRYLAESLPADWSSPQPRRSASTPSRWDDDLDDDDLPLHAPLEPASNPTLNPAAATAPLGIPVPTSPVGEDAAGVVAASVEPGAVAKAGRPLWGWAIVVLVVLALAIGAALKLTGAW